MQFLVCGIGFGLMVFCYWSIRPYLDIDQEDKQPYFYMIAAP